MAIRPDTVISVVRIAVRIDSEGYLVSLDVLLTIMSPYITSGNRFVIQSKNAEDTVTLYTRHSRGQS